MQWQGDSLVSHPVIRRILERKWPVDFWNVRVVSTRSEELCVRQNIAQPARNCLDEGLMITVLHNGGVGYCATSDMSDVGIARAFEKAKLWAEQTAGKMTFSGENFPRANPRGSYSSSVKSPYMSILLSQRLEVLKQASAVMSRNPKVVDNEAAFSFSDVSQFFASSEGASTEQYFQYFIPSLAATAHDQGLTQFRTLNGRGFARQAGFELFDKISLNDEAQRIAEEAVELLGADNCPEGKMDLILMPDQMMLQIHESIGHPLELDRILGDERNYAGTSFVLPEMFGSYEYGSPHLNITFDPTLEGEFATYKFDDEGNTAAKEYLIKDGILVRPLGGLLSQSRANMSGVANARASNWNRPPIDRMANLNLEPGGHSLGEIIASVENGVIMHSNISWSIDDSRNKFQFGCEYGQLIKNGRIEKTVRNPNYRGISATFWRNLSAVGDKSTFEMYGTPFCGKGEPNQGIRVGHASPACLFQNVEVFGEASK
jgi:predicted Zn-dependent protease